MKKILFTFLIIIHTFLLAETKHTMLPYSEIQPFLKSIDSHALVMGEGKKTVFVFLDPLCKFSRKFMRTVVDNSKMLSKYNYHIYLYEIPRLNSNNMIHHIYQSKTPLQELLKIMLEDKKPIMDTSLTLETKNTVRSIKEIAKELDIYKRPYIIISEDNEQ